MNMQNEAQAGGPVPRQCVWMEAGVVDYRLCDRDLDCEECAFDRGMRPSGTRPTPVSPGRASDQTLKVRGLNFPRDRFYDRHHLWARVEAGARVRVGLDALASSLLLQSHGFHPPSTDQRVSPGHASWDVIGRAGLLRLSSPIAGRVVDVNRALLAAPQTLLDDPYGAGWIFMLAPTHLERDLGQMHHGDGCGPWIESEIEQALLTWSELASEPAAPAEPTAPATPKYDSRVFTASAAMAHAARPAAGPKPVMADGGSWDNRGLLTLSRRQHRLLIQRTLKLGWDSNQRDASNPTEGR